MNGLHDLLAKIKKIEEAEAPAAAAAPAPAAAPAAAPAGDDFETKMKNYEAGKAKSAGIEAIKKYMSKPVNQIGRLENLIDAKTGFIYYGAAGMDASKGTPTKMPMGFMSQGDHKTMMDAITAAGLKVVDSGGYAMIDPKSLATLGQPAPAPAAPAPAAPAPAAPAGGDAQKPATNEFQPKIDRLKTILGLNVTVKESIVFKSKIGRLISEEFGILEAPAAPAVQGNARAEADALWAEISKAMETPDALTPEQRKDVENMTQAFQQFQQNNPLSQPAAPAAPADKEKPKSKIGYKNPGTKAYQNWLNTNGVTVAIDGQYGPETQGAYLKLQQLKPKEFGNAGGTRIKEMQDMMAAGTAYNVRQDKTDDKGYVWIGSKRYLEIMNKYGYDLKTGEKIGGDSQKVGPSSPTVAATAQPKTIADYDTAIKAVGDKLNQLYKADPNSAETKAANAELMKLAQGKSALMKNPVASAQTPGGAAAYTETPEYKKLLANLQTTFKSGAESPAYKQAMADFQAYISAQTPAPVAESGFANEELSRILSLVHHR